MQPAQNPYNQPNYGQGSPAPYGNPSPQSPRGTVSLDVIGEAWKLVQGSIGQWIVAFLIFGVALFVANIFTTLLQTPFRPSSGQAPSGGFYLGTLLGMFINSAIQGVVLGGLYRMAIANVRNGVANINDLFGITEVLVPVAIAAVLVFLVTMLGIICLIIPGIIAALGLAMTPFLVIDQKLQPVDAMKASWGAMQSNLGSFFVLGFVLGLINIAGLLACGVGVFVTFPLQMVALALVYRDLFGVGEGTAAPTGYIPPPIANPNF